MTDDLELGPLEVRGPTDCDVRFSCPAERPVRTVQLKDSSCPGGRTRLHCGAKRAGRTFGEIQSDATIFTLGRSFFHKKIYIITKDKYQCSLLKFGSETYGSKRTINVQYEQWESTMGEYRVEKPDVHAAIRALFF